MVEQRLQIARERVVVIATRRLTGLAEASTVIGDAAVSVGEQHPLLTLPGVAVERIAVNQDDRLAGPVVGVVDLDVGGVLSSDFDEWHGAFLSRLRPLWVRWSMPVMITTGCG